MGLSAPPPPVRLRWRLFCFQVSRRGAREPAEHDVVDRHHLPQCRLRRYRPQHLLRQRHRGHHRDDGKLNFNWFTGSWVNSLTFRKSSNYLQQICRECIELLLYRGFLRPIWHAKYYERSEDILHAKLVKGTRGEVKLLISREKFVVHNFIVFWNTK